MGRADAAHFGQGRGAVHQHPARAEHQRLDDEGGRRFRAAGALQRVERRLLRPGGGEGNGAHIEQQRRIGAVEHAARADRHRPDRIAVIGVLQHQDAVPRLAPVGPEPERHLQRHLDAGRAGIRIEHVGQAEQVDQLAGEPVARLVGPAGEDQLVELARLLRDRRDDPRVAVPVRRHPPRGDRVDHAPPVGRMQDRPLGPGDERDRLLQPVLGEGVPDGRASHCTLLPSSSS